MLYSSLYDSHVEEEKMARPKRSIDQRLVEEAQMRLKELRHGKVYLRLLVIVNAGEHPIAETARFFGISRNTIFRWIRRFRQDGVEGLYDRSRGHNPSKLTEEHKRRISHWLETATDARGEATHWTLEKLRHHIKRRLGVRISIYALWRHLRQLGFRQKVPRPLHHKAEPEVQEAFKKNC